MYGNNLPLHPPPPPPPPPPLLSPHLEKKKENPPLPPASPPAPDITIHSLLRKHRHMLSISLIHQAPLQVC